MSAATTTPRRLALLSSSVAIALFALAWLAGPASAAPVLDLRISANTTAAPGAEFDYFVTLSNVGDEPTSSPPQLVVALPSGVAVESSIDWLGVGWECDPYTTYGVLGGTVTCIQNPDLFGPGEPGPLTPESPPTRNSLIVLHARADAGVPQGTVETASFQASGGGSAATAKDDPITITSTLPGFGIDAFDGQISADASGAPYTQAGGHPYAATTAIVFNTLTNPTLNKGPLWPVEPVKDISVDLPVGFAGYPTATGEARCTLAQLANSEQTIAKPLCPPASQVGETRVYVAGGKVGNLLSNPLPVFNLATPPGVPARFGFNVSGTLVTMDGRLRNGSDYGLTVDVKNVSEGLAIAGTELTFWGVPSDHSHDAVRACPGELGPGEGGPSCVSEAPRRAFLRNPTSCQGPQPTTLHIDSWFNPGARSATGFPDLNDPNWRSSTFLSHDPPSFPTPPSAWGAPQGTTGCDDVPFQPSISIKATSHEADNPTGLDVDLSMPQSDDPATIGQADVKSAHVTLPEGMVVNPAAAAGLTGCTETQVGLNSAGDSSCPDASKIGTVTIDSPQLPDLLHGSIYQAVQGANPSHSLLAFYTVAEADGVIVKLAAHVEADPATGRLTTVFDDNPQLPFDHYILHFNDGPRAPLINPPTCGTATSHAVFTSWARPEEDVARADSFQITSGPNGTPCPNGLGGRPFAPELQAGVTDPTAGAASPFVLKLTRTDGEQRLRDLTVSTPPGLSAYLRGVPYCPEAQLAAAAARSHPGEGALELAAPSCPAASQIGTISAGAGAGPIPFHVNTGRVYLAGPYKGAPLSLAISVPAVAGPLDLGNVLVRAAVNLDPTSAQLTVVSDPLPQIVQGIPLDVRSLYVAIDRPHFTLAPTNCEPMSVSGTLGGSDGAAASPSQHFQVGSCSDLAFKPKLALRLKGKTKRSGFPALNATLTMPKKGANANIARAQVTLPPGLQIENAHIQEPCTRVQFNAGACPPSSILGHAKAITPLLDQPLEGPVYFRSNGGEHLLPDIVADLGGQIHVVLVGHIDAITRHGVTRIRNTFETVPDAPVSKFSLSLYGGKRGYLVNNRNLCASAQRAAVQFDGQNGKVADSSLELKTDCGKRGGGK